MSTPFMPSVAVAPHHSSDYFEQIPQWNANGGTKRFEIMADTINGRIPVTRLESWRNFTDLLESDFFNRPGVQLVFRGHRRYDWSLMPTLGRLTTNGIVTEALAQAQLGRFKRAVRGRLHDAAMVDEDDELFEDEALRTASQDEQPDILARYICKIYIRNEERDACLRHLRRMNVHHASLLPDLLGASEYCNVRTTEAAMESAVQQRGKHHEIITSTKSVTATDQADAAVTPSAATAATLIRIEDVLHQPAGAEQVEPGQIARMAEELASSIVRNKVVDWKTRDAVQARLRNVVRVVLRNYGYPQGLREQVAEKVLALAKLINGGFLYDPNSKN